MKHNSLCLAVVYTPTYCVYGAVVKMLCPFCGNPESKVVDKRDSDSEALTRRRRECLKCERRFTTYERVEASDLMVVKKDGRRERFSRDKVKIGVQKACEKRQISDDEIEKTVNSVEAELRKKDKKEVPSSVIGEIVMKKLKKLDKVAYIRFASVYRSFDDVETFKEELERLDKK